MVLRSAGLQVAPSTYYDAKTRPPSARAQRDAVLGPALRQLWKDNYQVCFIVDAHSRMIVGGGSVAYAHLDGARCVGDGTLVT
ncbi:hypothetical protein SAMN04489835_1706 [Mycolicibacterium rutilum]|uniref:Uncharacterized protein n=1 Tax=Mycolicibacterium rutilum TaxID=370526 RepID=A0A1H6JCB7_MYCRU|nr:hypothetical protein SAMN04489835_1706 [Mycolicibacterium rutilum]